jgi:hypothetical protein
MGRLLGQHLNEVARINVKVLPLNCRASAEAPPVDQDEAVMRGQRLHRGKRRRRIENVAVDEDNSWAVPSPFNPLYDAHPFPAKQH